MKKAVCLCLSVVLCLCLMPVSFAEEWVRADVPDLGLTIDFPETFYIVDRDTKPDDPLFEDQRIIYEDVMDALELQAVILFAVSKDFSTEITIRGVDSPLVSDLRLLQKDLLDFRISARKDALESDATPVDITSYDFFAHSQADFVKYYFEKKIDDSTVYYGTEYYTVCKNKEVAIDVTSHTGELSEAQDRLMDYIVSTVMFHEAAAETGLFGTTYKDEKTGLQFVIPAGFTETEMTEEQKQYVTAAFSNRNGECIAYGNADYYSELPMKERSRKTRREMRIDDLPQSYIEDAMNGVIVNRDQVVRVRKGDNEFYEAYGNISNGVVAFQARADLTVMNGYLLVFMDMWLENGDDSAMDQLLSSVKPQSSFSVLGDMDEQRKRLEDFQNRIDSHAEKYKPDGAELRDDLLSKYNAGAEGKNPNGDYFYFLYSKDEGNDALLVTISADREHYDGWEGMIVEEGDHVTLLGGETEVPFYLEYADVDGVFNMTFVNDGDVATMHFVDCATVVDDVVASRLEFDGYE